MRRGKLFIVVRFLSCNVRVTRACFAKLNAKAISNVLIRRIEENSYQITDTSSRIKRFLTEFNFANRTNRYKKKRFSSVVGLNNLRLLLLFFRFGKYIPVVFVRSRLVWSLVSKFFFFLKDKQLLNFDSNTERR